MVVACGNDTVAHDFGLGVEAVDMQAEGFLPFSGAVVSLESDGDHASVRRCRRSLVAGIAQRKRTDARKRDRLGLRRGGKREALAADGLQDPCFGAMEVDLGVVFKIVWKDLVFVVLGPPERVFESGILGSRLR
jgi:hypothetical protein